MRSRLVGVLQRDGKIELLKRVPLFAGCSKKDSVTAPKTGPTANFTASPLSGSSPLDVDFTNQSASGSSAITAVLWNFGDGATSTATSTSHLYGAPGTYTVSLRVTTADG